MTKGNTTSKQRDIYSSVGHTAEDQRVIAQCAKARTDFHILKQTPYIVGTPSHSESADMRSEESSNEDSSSEDSVDMSGEESSSEEYTPYSINNFCIPL